jgi:4'-phosphopantetheinyl transferase
LPPAISSNNPFVDNVGVAADPSIAVRTIHLEADLARLDHLIPVLSPDERDRANRFRFPQHRRRYIVCWGNVRAELSRYLDLAPAAIRFDRNPYGKPSVAGSGVRFNVSHSGDWAMLAVSLDREVGIDIEHVDPRFAQDQIPERFFSPREVEQLRSLPEPQQTEAFFRCWTRKEAYINARGLGLALALDSFDVSLLPNDPPKLSRAGDWSIRNLDAPAGYAAAIVAEGGAFTVSACSSSSGGSEAEATAFPLP